MAEYSGSALYLAFGGTTLQSDYRTFEPSSEIGLEDGSAGSDAAETYVKTLKRGNATCEMVAQDGATGTQIWSTWTEGSYGTLEWGPEGTVSNKPRRYVNAWLSKMDEAYEYNQVATWTFEWTFNGTVTRTAY